MLRNIAVTFLFTLSIVLAQKDREEIFKLAVGPCINDLCQSAHVCYYGQCVPEGAAPSMPPLNPQSAVGPCITGLCPRDTFCHQGECYPL